MCDTSTAVSIIQRYVDEHLFSPSFTWPKYEFRKRSYQQWAAYEICDRIMDKPFDDPITVIESFMFEMASATVDEDITSPHKVWMTPLDILRCTIEMLNAYRESYLETKDKQDWWQMIQLLPSSYNQKRTVMLNYEVLANMYKSRRNHKLDEWHTFCDWIESLPYSELITGEKKG